MVGLTQPVRSGEELKDFSTREETADIHAVPKGTDNGGLTPYQALTYLATLSAYLKACSEVKSSPSQRKQRVAETLRSTRGVPLGTQEGSQVRSAWINRSPNPKACRQVRKRKPRISMQYLKALIMVELTPYQALTYLATLSAYLKACSEAESLSSLIRLRRAKHTGDALQSSPKKRDSKRFFLYCCHRKEMQCNGIRLYVCPQYLSNNP